MIQSSQTGSEVLLRMTTMIRDAIELRGQATAYLR